MFTFVCVVSFGAIAKGFIGLLLTFMVIGVGCVFLKGGKNSNFEV